MNQKIQADEQHAAKQPPNVQSPKKLFNIQPHELQRHHRQPHLIQAPISNAKMKVSIQIHEIVRNISGVWTAVHRI